MIQLPLIIGAVGVTATVSAFFIGWAMRGEQCAKATADANAAVVEEYAEDRERQAEAGAEALGEYRDEIKALRRQLGGFQNEAPVDDGDVCNDAANGDRVWHAYREIFEGGLLPSPSISGRRDDTVGPAVETGDGPDG